MENVGILPDSIKSKLIIVDGHWIWCGAITDVTRKDPKGRVRFQGRMEYPHRVIMFLLKGFNLDSELQINHKRDCTESLCCNPEHLYIGTQRENIQDSIALGHNKELRRTHCGTCGSSYSISPTTGDRYCQRCKNDRRKKWRISKRGK